MNAAQQMVDIADSARREAESAELSFDFASERIQMKTRSSIHLGSGTAVGQVADIAAMTRKACDDLYATYQMLVERIDRKCRPLLTENPGVDAVCAVAMTIAWLNKQSEIGANFTGSVNGSAREDLVGVRYIPRMENKMAETFWESTLSAMPGSGQARTDYRSRLREEKRAQKEAERREAREKEERSRRVQLQQDEAAAEETRQRREKQRLARNMISCTLDGHAWLSVDGRIHVCAKSRGGFSDYEKEKVKIERFSDYQSVVLTNRVVVGLRRNGQCISAYLSKPYDTKLHNADSVRSWQGIIRIAAGFDHVAALRADGTCVCEKMTKYERANLDLSDWRDIRDIACGSGFVVGLKKDGTCVFKGQDTDRYERDWDMKIVKTYTPASQCTQWTDVEMIAAGGGIVVGITKNGQILLAGRGELPPGTEKLEGILQVETCQGSVMFLQADGSVWGQKNPLDEECPLAVLETGIAAVSRGYVLLMLKKNGQLTGRRTGMDFFSGQSGLHLFEDFDTYADDVIAQERSRIAKQKAQEEARLRQEKQQAAYRAAGLCQHCGGSLKKKLFGFRCELCGMKKDY